MQTASPPGVRVGAGAESRQLRVSGTDHLAQVIAVGCEDGPQPVGLALFVEVIVKGDGFYAAAWCLEGSGAADGGELQRPAHAIREGFCIGIGVIGDRFPVSGLDENDRVAGTECGAGQAQDPGRG